MPLFREPISNEDEGDETVFKQKEFPVQDPDGYLLRFSQEIA